MTPKEKAKELVEFFKDFVHGYVGSSFMTGDEYPESALFKAKMGALKCVNEISENNPHQIVERHYVDSGGNDTDETYFEMVSNEFYWQEVKKEIKKL